MSFDHELFSLNNNNDLIIIVQNQVIMVEEPGDKARLKTHFNKNN